MAEARAGQAAGTIEQRYSLGRCLGQGSFGVVYRALDVKRGVDVAIKRLSRLDPSAVYRFKQEFRALADVRHPNLVQLHELFSVDGEWYLVMELVEGIQLMPWVRDDGRLDVGRLRAALQQIAAGVDALHRAGKLHRDLKPGNVLVRPHDGHVTVLDFGLVATLAPSGEHLSIDQAIVGTPAYMAPEGATGEPITRASDWYGCGVLLFETLTGRLPFEGTPLTVLSEKLDRDAPDPRTFAPDAPADLAELCVALLARDPRLRPTGQDVLVRLGTHAGELDPSTGGSRPRAVVLVGRKRHREVLERALAATRTGRAVTVLVSGASGLGKSELVKVFLDDKRRARPRDTVVLEGRCYERESVPFNAMDSAIDTLVQVLAALPLREARALVPRDVHALAKLFPVLRRVEAVSELPDRSATPADLQELRRRAFEALRDLIGRLCDRRPVVLALDDLQWGDADSAALLVDLMRPPDPPALLLIATFRPEDVARSELLRELLAARARGDLGLDVIDLEVGPLERGDAESLALALLPDGEAAAALARDIARESGGSPLFVHELVRDARTVGGEAGSGPPSLVELIRRRVRALPQKTRRLVEIVAVAGEPVLFGVAMLAANVDPEAENATIDALRESHFVRARGVREGDELEMSNERAREILLASRTPSERADRHHRLARAMESIPGLDPERIYRHFRAAGDAARARGYAVQAAERAAEALAFDRAAELYRDAVELHGDQPRVGLRERLGTALVHAGRGAEAARWFDEAASLAKDERAPGLRRRACEQYLRSGQVDSGLGRADELLRGVGLGLAKSSSEAAASLLFRRGQLRLRGLGFSARDAASVGPETLARIDTAWAIGGPLSTVELLRGTALLTRHLLIALDAGEPFRIARALGGEATFTALTGLDPTRSLEVARLAREVAASVPGTAAMAYAASGEAIASFCAFRWRDTLRACEEALHLFREHGAGNVWEEGSIEYCLLRTLVALGRLGELSLRAPAALARALERGDLYSSTMLRTFVLVWRWMAEDRPEDGARDADDAIAAWSHRSFFLQHAQHRLTRVALALYRGELGEAKATLERSWPELERTYLLRNPPVRFAAWMLRGSVAVLSGPGGDSARVLDKAASVLAKDGAAHALGCAEVLRAGWAARTGRPADALRHLASADERFEAAESALFGAAVRRRRGELLGGDEGRTLEEQADAWMRAQGVKRPDRFASLLVPGVG